MQYADTVWSHAMTPIMIGIPMAAHENVYILAAKRP
jgi:hypothetical protein